MNSRDFTIIKRKNSPRWTLRCWNPERQRLVDSTTPFRIDDPQSYRKAVDPGSKLAREAKIERGDGVTEQWGTWVEAFLEARYSSGAKTLRRYRGAWSQWRAFLELRQICVPRTLS